MFEGGGVETLFGGIPLEHHFSYIGSSLRCVRGGIDVGRHQCKFCSVSQVCCVENAGAHTLHLNSVTVREREVLVGMLEVSTRSG